MLTPRKGLYGFMINCSIFITGWIQILSIFENLFAPFVLDIWLLCDICDTNKLLLYIFFLTIYSDCMGAIQ